MASPTKNTNSTTDKPVPEDVQAAMVLMELSNRHTDAELQAAEALIMLGLSAKDSSNLKTPSAVEHPRVSPAEHMA